jgi:hypothetical protein
MTAPTTFLALDTAVENRPTGNTRMNNERRPH